MGYLRDSISWTADREGIEVGILDTLDRQFLGENAIVDQTLNSGARTFDAGQHDRAARPGHLDRLGYRLRGFGGDIHDNVGALAPGQFVDPRDNILVGKIVASAPNSSASRMR